MILTQATFRRAFDQSRQLPVPANMRGWLFSILFRAFLEQRSRARSAW
jgi:DNA-directed RNA polymerase specialized sigma24 family protein